MFVGHIDKAKHVVIFLEEGERFDSEAEVLETLREKMVDMGYPCEASGLAAEGHMFPDELGCIVDVDRDWLIFHSEYQTELIHDRLHERGYVELSMNHNVYDRPNELPAIGEAYKYLPNSLELVKVNEKRGRLWWNADNWKEVSEKTAELASLGAKIISIKLDEDNYQYDYIFELQMDNAKAILGYVPEESEWLED